MLIGKIGEFGLIERIKKMVRTDPSVIRGPGDDCAVLRFNRNSYQLFTCDMIAEGIDFVRNENPLLIGRKAIAVSISDIAACGGIPRYCVVTIGLPKNSRVETVDKMLKGMLDICRIYRVNIVGGDLSRLNRLTIDVSMLGVVEKRNLVLRSGAKEGDIICVTGRLGGSIAGKHLRFIPRVKEARFLVENFKIHAMIDISDGLIQDLSHILKASKTGAVVYEELIPLAPQAASRQEALYAGEDFELLFTLSKQEARRLLSKKPSGFSIIGQIVDKRFGLQLVGRDGSRRIENGRGYRHF